MQEIKQLRDLKLPTWEEIPNEGIYMTEVINLLGRSIKPLFIGDENPISPSMINNYVKLSYIKEPINKKYYRESLAQIIAIGLFKQVMSIEEISKGVSIEIDTFGIKEVYDNFVDIFTKSKEAVLKQGDDISINFISKNHHDKVLYFLTLSLFTKLYTRITLKNR